MATLKFIIREKRLNSQGKTGIYIRYTHDQKSFLIATNEKVKPEHWDEQKQKVRKTYGRGYDALNDRLKKEHDRIDNIRLQESLKGNEPSIEHIRSILTSNSSIEKERKRDFFDLFDEYINQKRGHVGSWTIKHFVTAKNHFENFCKGIIEPEKPGKPGKIDRELYNLYRGKLRLEQINEEFYNRFVAYCYKKKLNSNTTGNQIKELKTFLNYLTRKGINTKLDYQHFKKPSAPIDIIYLTSEELYKLETIDLSKNKRLNKVRDLFLAGCYSGQRFSDYSHISKANIKDRFLILNIRKTDEIIRIPLTEPMKAMIEKYPDGLPTMSNQKFNDYLKELCQLAGINDDIEQVKHIGPNEVRSTKKKYDLVTSHTARRTFITQSLERGMRPETIMKITGHKEIKMLMRYVKITEKVVEDEMFAAWNKPFMKVS